jgi:hypothetical protein
VSSRSQPGSVVGPSLVGVCTKGDAVRSRSELSGVREVFYAISATRLHYDAMIDLACDNSAAGRGQHSSRSRVARLVFAGLVATATGSWAAQAGAATTTTRAPTTTTKTIHPRATTSTTVAHGAESEVQTVLSPIGLNVRAAPSKSAKVVVIAGAGAVLERLAYTSHAGGWYKVRGPSVTGWISSDPTYSAAGHFGAYRSSAFNVLFPAGWSASGSPHAGVTFRAPGATEKVVITVASSVASLPSVGPASTASEQSSVQVTACGVTAHLDTYATSARDRYVADVAFGINTQHALGMNATLTSLSQVRTVLNFVNSVSFPFKVCVGG